MPRFPCQARQLCKAVAEVLAVFIACCACGTGIYGVAKSLGLYQPSQSYWYIDNQTRSTSNTLTPTPSAVRAKGMWMFGDCSQSCSC